jgi:hypothetical protein
VNGAAGHGLPHGPVFPCAGITTPLITAHFGRGGGGFTCTHLNLCAERLKEKN